MRPQKIWIVYIVVEGMPIYTLTKHHIDCNVQHGLGERKKEEM
jgi:hypothetical protein